ncbi:hypothetical protein SISNIDRAFT_487209 [Sistotremastrum niveocremeum HHB9708]|uniref:Uncharacterized protein n=1 Tax=Sistotremastrum niveocremeum HHB9708 TaxID=1314777 RepID=A0A164SJ98_9AGAM|nr:hypothetical protein SISNIDRAFT_487209 [Sistotremastrum niveocremeum HHB9708]
MFSFSQSHHHPMQSRHPQPFASPRLIISSSSWSSSSPSLSLSQSATKGSSPPGADQPCSPAHLQTLSSSAPGADPLSLLSFRSARSSVDTAVHIFVDAVLFPSLCPLGPLLWSDFVSTLPSESVEKWKEELRQWEPDPDSPEDPYVLTPHETLADVRQELAQCEQDPDSHKDPYVDLTPYETLAHVRQELAQEEAEPRTTTTLPPNNIHLLPE